MKDISIEPFSPLSYAFGQPDITGFYKVLPEDFLVEEQIAFELSGEGEHLWCWVEKKGENTDWVLQKLAKWAGVSSGRVGVAGQKDRHAVTRQWFSIQLPEGKNPLIEEFRVENVKILNVVRHQRKLKTGGLSGNRFTLIIRNLKGRKGWVQALEARLMLMQSQGVPNYFGAQRFGLYGRNIKQGIKLLAGELPNVKRNQKSLYLSALRSWMFNQLLSQRVQSGQWNQLVSGDVLQLEGSNKWFLDDASSGLHSRIEQLDLHPTGALYGKGILPTQKEALVIEQTVAKSFLDWISALDAYGVQQDRRALRVVPINLMWQWVEDSSIDPVLKLSFSLRSGSYATMVLRELFNGEDYQVRLKSQKKE